MELFAFLGLLRSQWGLYQSRRDREQLGSRPDCGRERVCFGLGRMVLHKSEVWKYTSSLKALGNALQTVGPGERYCEVASLHLCFRSSSKTRALAFLGTDNSQDRCCSLSGSPVLGVGERVLKLTAKHDAYLAHCQLLGPCLAVPATGATPVRWQ